MKIVVGLGNPIPKYKNTRHNIGQEIVSFFQKEMGFPTFQFKKRLESLISEEKIGKEKIILVLPQTFMNDSGRAVKKIISRFKIPNLLVIHDDIDLPLGKIRIKKDSSSGGHNGIQSIIDYLKTEKFVRIKIGVSNEKRSIIPAEKFVLKKFDKEEQKKLEKVIKKSVEIVELWIKNNLKKQTIFL